MDIRRIFIPSICTLFSVLIFSPPAMAISVDELAKEVERLSTENKELQNRISSLETADKAVVRVDHKLSYEILDPTTKANRKQLLLLQKSLTGEFSPDSVYLGGAVTAILDYQKSNRDGKFAYLMRHPTENNQRTRTASEAIVHSAQLSLTGNIGGGFTGHMQALYNPTQSFGDGTITSLERNQVEMREAYILFGNLNYSPFYSSIGKMVTPFGLTDTPNPFTASTVWHAFGGLAYGISLSYSKYGLNLRMMTVQGGAQFRANNTSVDGTNIPSKLNNHVADASYTWDLDSEGSTAMMGVSYQRGSAYCQDYPVVHFNSCADNNPAYDIYLQIHRHGWMLQAEYAHTLDVWPGTFNPTIPDYKASKVTSWDVGGKYSFTPSGIPIDISLDFSRFIAGPAGSPWEKQDQIVFGVATLLTPSTKFFGEIIHTDGYAPLNFISGGNLGPGVTHSDRDATSNILLLGANIAF